MNAKKSKKKEEDIIYNWISILDKVESRFANEFLQIDITSGIKKERNVKIAGNTAKRRISKRT